MGERVPVFDGVSGAALLRGAAVGPGAPLRRGAVPQRARAVRGGALLREDAAEAALLEARCFGRSGNPRGFGGVSSSDFIASSHRGRSFRGSLQAASGMGLRSQTNVIGQPEVHQGLGGMMDTRTVLSQNHACQAPVSGQGGARVSLLVFSQVGIVSSWQQPVIEQLLIWGYKSPGGDGGGGRSGFFTSEAGHFLREQAWRLALSRGKGIHGGYAPPPPLLVGFPTKKNRQSTPKRVLFLLSE